jgi:hypothetical protein
MSAQTARFDPGQIETTPNAITIIPHDEIQAALSRHMSGDWGTLDNEDRASNERGLANGGRLFSEYHSKEGIKFWIITDADRAMTTVLLPKDY